MKSLQIYFLRVSFLSHSYKIDAYIASMLDLLLAKIFLMLSKTRTVIYE